MDNNNFQFKQNPVITSPQSQLKRSLHNVRSKKRIVIMVRFLLVMGLIIGVLFTFFYFILRIKLLLPQLVIGNKNSLETSVALTSNPIDWPTYVNLQVGYALKYPRELLIREIFPEAGYIPFVDNDVAFEIKASKPEISILVSVIKDTNIQSLVDWVKRHSGSKVSSEERYFKAIKNLKQSKLGNSDAIEFIESKKLCLESCVETLTRRLIIKKEHSLIGFSCSSCPKNVDFIWKEMANSLVTINNNNPTISVSKTTKYTHADISISYPSGWFVEDKELYFILSSFNKKGSYLYGIEIFIERCGYNSILDCMRSQLFHGANMTKQEVIDVFGGIVEKIDTPLIEGYIFGQMKPEIYKKRNEPMSAFLISKKNSKVVSMSIYLSLYGGSFELKKRIVDYYYPAIKNIILSLEIF